MKKPATLSVEEFTKAYEQLSSLGKLIVKLCALFNEPIRPLHIFNCLLTRQIKSAPAPGTSEKQILATLQDLETHGFVKEDLTCPPDLVHLIMQESVSDGSFSELSNIITDELPPLPEPHNQAPKVAWARAMRDLRLSLYSHDDSGYNRNLLTLLELQEQHPTDFTEHPLVTICNTPFDGQWFNTLPLHTQFYALNQILMDGLLGLKPTDGPLAYLQQPTFLPALPEESRGSFAYLLISNLLIRGSVQAVPGLLQDYFSSQHSFGLSGWLAFLNGDTTQAIELFENDLQQIQKANRSKQAYFTGPEGLFFILALLKEGDYRHHGLIESIVQNVTETRKHSPYLTSYKMLLAVVFAKNNNIYEARRILQDATGASGTNSINLLFCTLSGYWIEGQIDIQLKSTIQNSKEQAEKNKYLLFATEFSRIFAQITAQSSSKEAPAKEPSDLISLFSIVDPEEQWQRALRALNFTSPAQALGPKEADQQRLAWLIGYEDNAVSIAPKVQGLTKSNVWTKGRAISLKKLFSKERPPFLTAQDHQVCAAILELRNSRGPYYRFALNKALPALIGHPHLFLEGSAKVVVEFLKGEPELQVDQKGNFLHVQFVPTLGDGQVVVARETPTRFSIYPIVDDHRRIHSIIGPEGLVVPVGGKEDLFATLGNISSFMTVHSTMDGRSIGINEVPTDSRIHLQLLPHGSGFRLAMLVRPLYPAGPFQRPGDGPQTIIAQVQGKKTQTVRNLKIEEQNALQVEQACPTLTIRQEMEREWILQDPEECLQMLLEIQRLPEDVIVEWPEGERLTVSPPASLNQLHLNIRKNNNWFEIDGKLQLDKSLVLDMRKLLEVAQTTSSRFIPLGEGHYLTLTRELKKMLDEIGTYSEIRKKGLRLHPLAAMALDSLHEDMGHVNADTPWYAMRQRLEEAQEIDPALPSTLQAELRDYQLEGFKWLARLAHWGVGACLADDMGLGKTLQALAIILHRAADGPTLIVAPTSVCLNWLDEASRFAPTLKPIVFGGRNRKRLLAKLEAFDMLIVSYGLLQQEAELLAQYNFHTIVLDEAQAIKNIITKRSKAAMQLKGDFKVLTTGTPIENHLPELWNLFNFINPGLLGSLSQFNKRFAIPIEKNRDREAKRKLKKLIRPFILRRIKSQVLEELPSRTEILLQVEMNDKERAFYEALRLEAIDNLSKRKGPPGARSLQILAEIMKLRRACCNPRLVLPESSISSSKLDLFGKVISELMENRHKALVFSQFVDHLSLIREYLDTQQISYKYLDGNTPAKERQAQVKDFQSGNGDLFLISLKAGGLGLNLTAADYVIHMDPWWNPAVEDQASDRAHRIGQLHPVTIYRLVARHTIEEKIVQLHHEKRELADSLLEGTDVSTAMSAHDLINLLTDE